MKRFSCPNCRHEVFFGSLVCNGCRSDTLYDPFGDTFVPAGERCATSQPLGGSDCNWIALEAGSSCFSCSLDRPPPETELARPFQSAKRRTLRQLISFGIDPSLAEPRLGFDLRPSTPQMPVLTGHAGGLITIDISEADPVTLVENREDLGEPYRTPLGHVRHELGHWFWDWAVGNVITIGEMRERFGDERIDYATALQRHYATPDDGAWRTSYLSHYASAHPWEDFAETFAHVLHIDDTLETATAHGLATAGSSTGFEDRYTRWIDLALALNELNRSMGTPDPYPFVVPPAAVEKLAFVDGALRSVTTSS